MYSDAPLNESCPNWETAAGGYFEACGGSSGNEKCVSGLPLDQVTTDSFKLINFGPYMLSSSCPSAAKTRTVLEYLTVK